MMNPQKFATAKKLFGDRDTHSLKSARSMIVVVETYLRQDRKDLLTIPADNKAEEDARITILTYLNLRLDELKEQLELIEAVIADRGE